mgnify:FL=1
MIKKLTAVILILTLLCTLFALSAGAAQSAYMSDAKLLYALGISDSEPTEDSLRSIVTRAEFLDMMLRASGAETDGGFNDRIFSDVPKEHAYYKEIGTAYTLGIIAGNGEGLFNPDDPIIYEQAMAMIVNALGYKIPAQSKGGYSGGYLAVGGTYGISDGVSCIAGEILRYGTACRLIANALNAPVMTEDAFDTKGNVISRIDDNETFSKARLKIEKRKGIVNGNEVTMLTRSSRLDGGIVEIEGVKYRAGKSGVENLLGYNVEFYVDISNKTDDVKPILYAAKNKNTQEITVESDDILPERGLSVTALPYTNDKGRKEIARISPYADLIDNGVSVGGFRAEDLIPSYGEVELIDNNNDGTYDVVKVWDYVTIIADSISSHNQTVYDKYDGALSAKFDNDGTAFIYKDGERVDFSSIGELDVISAAISRAGSNPHITAYISRESVDGKLNQFSDDGVYINDVFYEVVPAVKERIIGLGLGTEGSFFLDKFNRIAGFNENSRISEKATYGYIIKAGTDGTLKKTVQLKMLTPSNKIEIFNCAEKVTLDGTTVNADGDNVLKALRSASTAADAPGSKASDTAQIIRYSLNSDGEIKMIDTLLGKSDDTDEDDMLSWDAGHEKKRRKYMRPSRMIGKETAEIALNEDTVCFKIPAVGYEDDEDEYMAGSIGLDGNGAHDILYPSKDYDSDIWGYDLNAVKVAGAVIVVSDGASTMTESDSMLAMVSKISVTKDEDGMETYRLTLVKGGKFTDYICTEESVLDSSKLGGKTLARGDVIYCKANTKKEISHIEKIAVDIDEDRFADEGYIDYQSYFYPKLKLIYGYIEEKIGKNIIMVADDPANTLAARQPCLIENAASVAVFNKKSKEVEFTTVGELGACIYNNGSRDKVVLISATTTVTDIYIIREE